MRQSRIRIRLKRLLFPGLDLNTRSRYRFLPGFFRQGPVDTLDAGCGNGALSYAAYRAGNRVLGITSDVGQIATAQHYFVTIGADVERLAFMRCNLYDMPGLSRKFDQIICSETLEHISQDSLVIELFSQALRSGGILHLCCPYAPHPNNHLGRTNNPEDGGHVRDGYTMESYQKLLEPSGFRIIESAGLGTPLIGSLNKVLRKVRNKAGDMAALPLFLLIWPLTLLDHLNPDVPLSLYVQAVKR